MCRLTSAVEAAPHRPVRWPRRASGRRDEAQALGMDAAKVDLILEYALAVAAEADGQFERRLGRIHLLKYVYLADLAQAERDGVTFTGTPWRFYHYGPWSTGVNERIDSVIAHSHATEHVWHSTKYEADSIRWSVDRDHAQDRLREVESCLPVSVALAVRRTVRAFGNDTSSLLHHVYATAPMLHAAPGQMLDFAVAKREIRTATDASGAPEREPTAKELKKRKEARLKLKGRFRAATMLSPSGGQLKKPSLEPIYDDIFRVGAEQIEALAGTSPDGLSGDANLSDDIWTSEIRKRGRLP